MLSFNLKIPQFMYFGGVRTPLKGMGGVWTFATVEGRGPYSPQFELTTVEGNANTEIDGDVERNDDFLRFTKIKST